MIINDSLTFALLEEGEEGDSLGVSLFTDNGLFDLEKGDSIKKFLTLEALFAIFNENLLDFYE